MVSPFWGLPMLAIRGLPSWVVLMVELQLDHPA